MAKKDTAKATGPIFAWKRPAPETEVDWGDKDELVLEIKQLRKAVPLPEGKDYVPWLMIYEADNKIWTEQKQASTKNLDPLLAIHGKISDEGKFSVTKAIDVQKNPAPMGLKVQIKLLDTDEEEIQLKDKDGKDITELELVMPTPDPDDETWELDLAFRFSEKKQRLQHRLIVRLPSLKNLLKDDSKYKDKTKDLESRLNASWGRKHSSKDPYKLLYVHCMSNPWKDKSLDKWMEYGRVIKLFKENPLSAHFIIERSGDIQHCLPCYRQAWHAGKGLTGKIGGKLVKGNSYSIGIELAGLIDDIQIPLRLCLALYELANNAPDNLSSGKLGDDGKKALKKATNFLCHGKGNAAHCINMIDGMSEVYSAASFKSLTDQFCPGNRSDWKSVLSTVGKPDEIARFAIQLIFVYALLSGDKNGVELEVTNRKRVAIKDGKGKCTIDVNLDNDKKITLYRMKKGEEFEGRAASGKEYVTVPKDKIIDYSKKKFDAELLSERSENYGNLKSVIDSGAAEIAKLLNYTDAQYAALADLSQAIIRTYHCENVITHHFASSKRKRDPGVYFDWDKYLGHANLKDVRELDEFEWKASDDNRAPKGFAERTTNGCWPEG